MQAVAGLNNPLGVVRARIQQVTSIRAQASAASTMSNVKWGQARYAHWGRQNAHIYSPHTLD